MTRTRSARKTRKAPNLRLARLRLNAGLSQRQLAYLAGVSPGVVQLAEKGWTPHPGNALRVASVLGVRYTDIWPLPGDGGA